MTDFSGPWTAADVARLRAEWDRHSLLLLRGGLLSGEEQVGFAARFGPLVPERHLWGYVSNVREDGIVREGALLFHSDFAFTPSPVLGISLHALEVPADGAPTRFADAVRAAASLPEDLRRRLQGREVLNVYDFYRPDDQPMRIDEVDPRSPRCAQAVIGHHPRTGAEVIFANELHTDHVIGVPPRESDALLSDLFDVLYDDDYVYEHRWEVGDLILWDNITLHHGRHDIGRDEPRTLQRVTLGAYTPGELVPGLAELLRDAE
jgi:taurine dioxygenase